MTTAHDQAWGASMDLALAAARSGLGHTAPNPSVGVVIVDDHGRVLGTGTSEEAGGAHAEVVALRRAKAAGHDVRGATMVVTLEPCCHHGRTPPCTDAIIAGGIARVVAGVADPFEAVRGRGFQTLRDAGVEVVVGVREAACTRQILGFARAQLQGLPEVSAKAAVSLDGHIATAAGDSAWITGEEARTHGRRLRLTHDAILVGRGTALADDPRLTARSDDLGPDWDPVPVVFDSKLQLPADLRMFRGPRRAIVVTTEEAPERALPADVLRVPSGPDGRVDPVAALRAMVARGLHRVLVEGGGELHGSLFSAGLVDTLYLYVAGVLVPGGRPWLAGEAVEPLARAARLQLDDVEQVGEDLCTVWRATHRLGPLVPDDLLSGSTGEG